MSAEDNQQSQSEANTMSAVSQHVSQSQQAVLEVAIELVRMDHRLHQLATSLPLPPDLTEMENDEVPHDAAAYLHGVINCVRTDMIQSAVNSLRTAAYKSDSELRADCKQLYTAWGQAKEQVKQDLASKKKRR